MDYSQEQNISREYSLLKILILGDQAVGKTSLLLRYIKSDYSEDLVPTLGVDFKQKEVVRSGKFYSVQIWDSAGQERFRSVTKTYYRKASGILLSFDRTDIESFLNVKQWVKNIKDELEPSVPIVLVSTKSDLPESVSQTQAKDLAKSFGLPFFKTSSKTGEGVNEVFDYLIDEILRQDPNIRDSLKISRGPSLKKKKTCC